MNFTLARLLILIAEVLNLNKENQKVQHHANRLYHYFVNISI